jgi:GNAT superfamily N-acetyltransferase
MIGVQTETVGRPRTGTIATARTGSMTDDIGKQPALQVREARDADLDAILALLSSSLGWVPNEQYADFYRWKHHDNPFGRSPAWVALDGDRIVGLRVWLRWRFRRDGQVWEAVRAVDTATHPEYQGRGIFRRLTTSSLEELAAQGVAHVFNTPNEQSRPGYLKMGWEQVGKLAVGVRFRSPLSAGKALRARVPADKWSLPTDAGDPAAEVLADTDRLESLLAVLPDDRIRTDLTPEVLRWRYGFEPLHYRAIAEGGGIALFRLRRRGPATECVIGHLLAPEPVLRARLIARVARVSGADQVLRISSSPEIRARELPLPGGGPVLTWRALQHMGMPTLEEWELSMGDVELF